MYTWKEQDFSYMYICIYNLAFPILPFSMEFHKEAGTVPTVRGWVLVN